MFFFSFLFYFLMKREAGWGSLLCVPSSVHGYITLPRKLALRPLSEWRILTELQFYHESLLLSKDQSILTASRSQEDSSKSPETFLCLLTFWRLWGITLLFWIFQSCTSDLLAGLSYVGQITQVVKKLVREEKVISWTPFEPNVITWAFHNVLAYYLTLMQNSKKIDKMR